MSCHPPTLHKNQYSYSVCQNLIKLDKQLAGLQRYPKAESLPASQCVLSHVFLKYFSTLYVSIVVVHDISWLLYKEFLIQQSTVFRFHLHLSCDCNCLSALQQTEGLL